MILHLALYWERKSTGIWYRNVTTARIKDKSLLDKALQSKMVDYWLIVDLDEALDEQIETMMSARGLTSISYSDVEYLRFKIIGVSIEVKRALIGENEAEIQMATWVKAHYAKLQQLVPWMRTVPVLPLVCIRGHIWKFMLAQMAFPTQVIIHREVVFGRTDSMLGIYQAIARVKRMAGWMQDVYKPWFLEQVMIIGGETGKEKQVDQSVNTNMTSGGQHAPKGKGRCKREMVRQLERIISPLQSPYNSPSYSSPWRLSLVFDT